MTRKAVLLRVGVDSVCGRIQGPLFKDGGFDFVCIPGWPGRAAKTYGQILGRDGRPHSDYFPPRLRGRMHDQPVHVDPEWETFTYGDPTTLKRSLKDLEPGDFLVFYCGLQRWDETRGFDQKHQPALYLCGYFEVSLAGLASEIPLPTVKKEFRANSHVSDPSLFRSQMEELVLVKGGKRSRLFKKAHQISCMSTDKSGRPLKVLSPAMQKIFGTFGGKISIQRCPPRWVEEEFVEKSIAFVTGLR